MKCRKSFLVLILIAISTISWQTTFAQKNYYKQYEYLVGHPVPSFFFEGVEYFEKSKVSSEDFKGKWLVLDFWTQYCGGCIKSFPKINELQKKFKKDFQFLMVACKFDNTKDITKEIFERSRQLNNLDLPVVYDSVYYKAFNIQAFPFSMIIDPDGIVREVGAYLSEESLDSVLKNGTIMGTAINENGTTANGKKLADSTFTYQSYITKWAQKNPEGFRAPSRISDGREIIMSRVDLNTLFKYAIGYQNLKIANELDGNLYPQLLLEIPDTSMFVSDYTAGIGIYNYYLRLPDSATKEELMHLMREDLERTFGYDIRIEKRTMPCWYMLLIDDEHGASICTKGDKPFATSSGMGITLINQNVKRLLHRLNSTFRMTQPPIIDNTNLNCNIDLSLKGLVSDFSEIKAELEKNGLRLEQGVQEFNVAIITKAISL